MPRFQCRHLLFALVLELLQRLLRRRRHLVPQPRCCAFATLYRNSAAQAAPLTWCCSRMQAGVYTGQADDLWGKFTAGQQAIADAYGGDQTGRTVGT